MRFWEHIKVTDDITTRRFLRSTLTYKQVAQHAKLDAGYVYRAINNRLTIEHKNYLKIKNSIYSLLGEEE